MATRTRKKKASAPKSPEDVKHPDVLYARTDSSNSEKPEDWFLLTTENPAEFVDKDGVPFKFTVYCKVGTGSVTREARIKTKITK